MEILGTIVQLRRHLELRLGCSRLFHSIDTLFLSPY